MLSRIAREFAAEISGHDWSDAPYRVDRAGHTFEPDRIDGEPLSSRETENVRTNVFFVVAQVLKHADPQLDLHEFAEACGVPTRLTRRSNGSPSGIITNGLRWADHAHAQPYAPGHPLAPRAQ